MQLSPVRATPPPAYPTLRAHRARRVRRRRWGRLAAVGLAAALALPLGGCRTMGVPVPAQPPPDTSTNLEAQANLISRHSSLRVETDPPNQVGRCQVMNAAEMEAARRAGMNIEHGRGTILRRWTPFKIAEVPLGHAVYLRLEILHQGRARVMARFVPFRPDQETVITWDVTEDPEAHWQVEFR